jgi:hypothetical protein
VLWRLERAGEAIKLILALSPDAKARALLSLAEERLSELQQCADDPACARACCEEYAKALDACLSECERHGLADVAALVANATSHHQRVLESLLGLVPEEAQPWIQMAMERSMRGHERAAEAVRMRTGMGYEEYMERHMPRR